MAKINHYTMFSTKPRTFFLVRGFSAFKKAYTLSILLMNKIQDIRGKTSERKKI